MGPKVRSNSQLGDRLHAYVSKRAQLNPRPSFVRPESTQTRPVRTKVPEAVPIAKLN